jgi:hypothetical protein
METTNLNNEELYLQARNIYYHTATDQGLEEARELFAKLGDYKNSADFVKKCDHLLDFKVGNTVTYGSWEGKPIQWNVIGEDGKMRLLLSSDIVTHQAFHKERTNIYWSTCSLRKWLNREFLNEAFPLKERMSIVGARRTNESNHVWSTQSGPDTVDKVFALSHQELEHYLPEPESRIASEWWWMRTMGHALLAAECVYTDGSEYHIGLNVADKRIGVRPAMWVLMNRN